MLLFLVMVESFFTAKAKAVHDDRQRRAVFDLIPRQNSAEESAIPMPGSGLLSSCPEEDTGCVLDETMNYKKTLNILHGKEIVFSGQHRRVRRKRIKKLFAKWMKQKKNSLETTTFASMGLDDYA